MLPLVRGGALLLAVVLTILVDYVAHAFLPMPRCIMVSKMIVGALEHFSFLLEVKDTPVCLSSSSSATRYF